MTFWPSVARKQPAFVHHKMRIAFITSEFVTEPSFSGGLANYLGRVTLSLSERGHDVHVFTRSTQSGEPFSYHGLTVHRVVPLWDRRMIVDHIDPLVPRSLYNVYQDIKAAWCLHRSWKKEDKGMPFDITQIANVSACGLFFPAGRKNLITRLSSYRPLWDTSAGVEPDRAVKLRWKLEEKAIRRTSHHFAPTRFVASLAEQHYGIGSVDIVPSPFFLEESSSDSSLLHQLGLDHEKFLLFFGRLTRMKGIHRIAEALPTVLSEYPQMKMLFVGADTNFAPGGGSMRDYIHEQNPEHAERILFHDPVRHDVLYPTLKKAHLVLHPSLVDNMPNSCLEAMGLSKPVIATRGSCFDELITDGETGFLCEADCSASLREKILHALALPQDELNRIGTAASRRIELLKPERTVNELLEYYSEIASSVESGTPMA